MITCNVIDRTDGFNISTAQIGGKWVGDPCSVACNREAVAVGEWRKRSRRKAFMYVCNHHLSICLEHLPEKNIDREYFAMLGKIKSVAL